MDNSALEQMAKEIGETAIATGAANAAMASGGVVIGDIMKDALINEANAARQLSENFLPSEDLEGEYIPLAERFDLGFDISEPGKNVGFVYVGNDTWLPKALYEAQKRQRSLMARKPESSVVWTG